MTKSWPFEYALLRAILDTRPRWAINIGLHSFLLNNEEVRSEYPRLRYKRKIGSHPVNPHAGPEYVKEQEERYIDYYKELINMI